MSDPLIQFLSFDGCPLADAARQALEQALTDCNLRDYEDVDILAPDVTEDLRGWGSPTILIDGEDVAGQPKGDDVGCRIYAGSDRVPSAMTIAARIRRARPLR